MSTEPDNETQCKKVRLSQDPVDQAQPQSKTMSIGFSDLIFSVTGTVPQAFDLNVGLSESGLVGLENTVKTVAVDCNAELKRKVPVFRQKNQNPARGGICYSAEPVESNSNESLVLAEEDVGIVEYISQHQGFSGILKQRFSDFVVNEISKSGEVVHLTDISMPPKISTPDDTAEDEELLSEEQKTQLRNISETKSKDDCVSIAANCKVLRGKLHAHIKERYPDLDCNTVEENGVKSVVVRFRDRRDLAGNQRQKIPPCFSKAAGNYCKFVLYKENSDTQYAITTLSKYLRIHPNNFGYAGTKDRRAKTSQEVTVYRTTPYRLYQVNKTLRNIRLGNFRICKDPLKLGDLSGNRFVVVLRNVTGSDEQIESGMTSLCNHGFINYYGMQRFGTTRIPTHSVGRALLKGDWSEAVELIMKPREGDRPEMSEARKVWQETRDAAKTLMALRGYMCNEKHLLEGLRRSPANDLVGALSFIPRNMRLMYVHAYQSYIWNCVVSRRIRELGLLPRCGDLVYRGLLDETAAGVEEKIEDVSRSRIEPILVTEENIAEYSITDVVMPLPGFDVRYPENECKAWYKELLSADGMEDYDFRNKVKDYSLPGSYRKFIVKPGDLSWKVLRYDDYETALSQSDLDLINGPKELLATTKDDGKYKALRIELSLPSSSYATMAIREVLKCGTSAAYQATLNTA